MLLCMLPYTCSYINILKAFCLQINYFPFHNMKSIPFIISTCKHYTVVCYLSKQTYICNTGIYQYLKCWIINFMLLTFQSVKREENNYKLQDIYLKYTSVLLVLEIMFCTGAIPFDFGFVLFQQLNISIGIIIRCQIFKEAMVLKHVYSTKLITLLYIPVSNNRYRGGERMKQIKMENQNCSHTDTYSPSIPELVKSYPQKLRPSRIFCLSSDSFGDKLSTQLSIHSIGAVGPGLQRTLLIVWVLLAAHLWLSDIQQVEAQKL